MRSIVAVLALCISLPAFAGDPKYEYKDPTTPPPAPPQPVTGHISWKANMTFGLVYVGGNAQSLGLNPALRVRHWRFGGIMSTRSGFPGAPHVGNCRAFPARQAR